MERASAFTTELARRGGLPTRRGGALQMQCEAELRRAQGCPDPRLWAAAAEERDRVSHPFEAAYARWRQAEAHLAAQSKAEVAATLREALSGASRLGSRWLVGEIEGLARRAHIRLRSAAPEGNRSAGTGPLGLTTRETEVLALLAEGRTNQEIAAALFMSEKTASVHVSRILTKLGVANRGQAAALAHRLWLLGHDGQPSPATAPGRTSASPS
jgi:DNA-binding CsgD family transcriptional regulator